MPNSYLRRPKRKAPLTPEQRLMKEAIFTAPPPPPPPPSEAPIPAPRRYPPPTCPPPKPPVEDQLEKTEPNPMLQELIEKKYDDKSDAMSKPPECFLFHLLKRLIREYTEQEDELEEKSRRMMSSFFGAHQKALVPIRRMQVKLLKSGDIEYGTLGSKPKMTRKNWLKFLEKLEKGTKEQRKEMNKRVDEFFAREENEEMLDMAEFLSIS